MFVPPGVDMNAIFDGLPLSQQWEFYTINVKMLGTMTHEEFCLERPQAAKEIERASKLMDEWNKIASRLDA
jgi:hypothetical protein